VSLTIGYARCSTDRQDTDRQRTELERMGCERLYIDHGLSGKTAKNRPRLQAAIDSLRPGDTFAVTALDRLARSLLDLQELAGRITTAGASLQFGSMTYTPSDPIGVMFFQILGAFAEFERNLISARTKDGLERAKAAGKMRGRPHPKLTRELERELVREYETSDLTTVELAAKYGIGRSTLYRALDRAEIARPHAA
jgi:DNA invertase Pin-like site-specific DNA recombinase